MNSVSNIIEVHHLSFQYNCTNVFQNLHFELQEHKFVGLFGANGSGKSTFLRLILGELKCFSGSIHLFGQSVSKFHTWHKIGYVPQIGLAKQMDFPATVKEVVQANLYSSLGLFRFPGKKETTKVEKTLSLLHMEDFSSRLIGELSGGQRQKVLLARALVSNPSLLILDEPINGLDPEGIREMRETLLKLNKEQGMTMIISSHILGELNKLATTFGIIKDGVLIQEISKDQLDEKCKEYLSIEVDNTEKACFVLEEMTEEIEYEVKDQTALHIYNYTDSSKLISEFVNEGIAVQSATFHNQDLEEYFLSLMEGGESHV